MALTSRALYRNCNYIRNITKPVKWSVDINHPVRILANGISYQGNALALIEVQRLGALTGQLRQCSTQCDSSKPPPEPPVKKGLVQRLKEMYRDYWYVVLPVHLVTSAVWFGGFYYAVRSGVDVIAILQSLGVSETLLSPLRESAAGYFALAFALYKLATPLRYAVTVGGTTYAINKLTAIGLIKPVPSSKRIKEMIQEKKDMFQEKKDNFQDKFNESKQHYQTQMTQKRSNFMDDIRRYKTEMRNMKDKMKKM